MALNIDVKMYLCKQAMMAALFAYVGTHFSGPLGAVIGAAAGIIAGYLVGSEILKDEKGVIWYG